MGVAIASIGLATAQGGSADISGGVPLHAPEPWPWPLNGWSTSRICRPAVGVPPNLNGLPRWQALVQLALEDCFGDEEPSAKTPIFVGSCNGSAGDFVVENWSAAFDSTALLAGTAWAGQRLPVLSSSCNSGLHALYAARRVLMSGQADEAVVLAADILSRSNQDNFEVLRVLTDTPMLPWQPTSTGFILGEAAIALKLVREGENETLSRTHLIGPVLANELSRDDGLPRVIGPLSTAGPQLLLGQGTGPVASDESELAAFQLFVPCHVPLATSLVHFGHTLGASGLLAIALAGLIQRNPQALSALAMPSVSASNGRPLNMRSSTENSLTNNADVAGNVLVTCRALNGSCAAAIVGNANDASAQQGRQWNQERAPERVWHAPVSSGPLMNTLLRRLAEEAPRHRPVDPPDVLLVRMDEPLAPPPEARVGERILPSAVLEMTPGFVSQLIARSWGFAGSALCLVGNSIKNDVSWDLRAALDHDGFLVSQVDLLGTGDKREIVWNN
ncbi:MAG TPA: beta-ketoacyl synthase N-terminal-like domain-containing protein [Pyrinomonadaceae bacterium]